MKIGIFGGTFNPIHKGHIFLSRDVKEELGLDVIYFVPTYKTPDKNFFIEKISPKYRYNMVYKTIKSLNLNWMKISNFEFKNKEISYTYKTINYFKKNFPNSKLFLIIGEDRYNNFYKWKNVNTIINNANLVVYRRFNKINNDLISNKSIIYLHKKYYKISSQKILNEIKWDYIPRSAKKYIKNKKIYLKTLVFNVLKEKRYEHSVAVSSHAKRLAVKYKYKNVKIAELAGLVHDLFKLHSSDFLINYYKNNNTNWRKVEELPIPSLHGFVCALWLKGEYGIKNKKFLNSIKYHTLATKNPTKLDKIIFVADKISSDRKGDEIHYLRKLAYLNLDETYKKLIKRLIKKLTLNGIKVDKDTMEAYKKYFYRKNKFTLKKVKKINFK